MRESLETLVDNETNLLGEAIAKASHSEEEYAKGLEYAIEILQEALGVANSNMGFLSE